MKKYIKLLKRINKIDPDAALYIIEEAPQLSTYCATGDLGYLFLWSETPQGHEYWKSIRDKL